MIKLSYDKKLLPAIDEIESHLISLQISVDKVNEKIFKIQLVCDHIFEKVMEASTRNYSPRVNWNNYGRVYIGKTCTKCKLYISRREGMPWNICYQCGGEMEYEGISVIGQGYRVHSHKCKECSHVYETT